jgi:hypothetical protein
LTDTPLTFRVASAHRGDATIEIRKTTVDGELLRLDWMSFK